MCTILFVLSLLTLHALLDHRTDKHGRSTKSFSRQLDMVRYGSPPVSVESGEIISTDLNWSTGRVGVVGEEDRTIKLCFTTRKKVLASLAFTNTFADLISRTLYEFSVALH